MIMFDPAGGTEDGFRRGIVLASVAIDVVAAERANDLFGAEHRAADGLIGVGRLLKPVEDNIVRRVVGLMDFLADHRFLAL